MTKNKITKILLKNNDGRELVVRRWTWWLQTKSLIDYQNKNDAGGQQEKCEHGD
jgi:hypothetical protein